MKLDRTKEINITLIKGECNALPTTLRISEPCMRPLSLANVMYCAVLALACGRCPLLVVFNGL